MAKLIPRNHKHLTQDEHIFIEQSLDEGKSFREFSKYPFHNLQGSLETPVRKYMKQMQF